MSKKEFWSRLALYILIGGVIPFLFLTWRFKLFEKVEETVTKVSIGGWGIVAIIFVSIFFLKTINALRRGMPFSFGKQILDGLSKTILPLLIFTVAIYMLQDVTKELFQFLCVTVLCEMIAVCINPIPRWAHENNIDLYEQSLTKMFGSLLGGKK